MSVLGKGIETMNDWKPTHKTRAGVEVMARREQLCMRVLPLNDAINSGALFGHAEFAALFEPIPRPVMVEIPLELAKRLETLTPDGHACAALSAAIRAAEQENET
jgi:hypothetical protein